MATQWDSIAAAKQGADQPHALNGEHALGCDDAVALEKQRTAEILMKRGVDRRTACLCAGDVFAAQSARDVECAGDGAGVELGQFLGHPAVEKQTAVEGVRQMAVRLVQAPKPRFSAGCLLLAMGAEQDGVTSAREWAVQQCVSHELAAREVAHWSTILALPPTHARKTAAQKKIYRDTNGRQKRAKL